MQGYDNTSYGEAFADVYDDWYSDIGDVDAAVEVLAQLAQDAGALPIVELGVGTGRIAIPLAQRVHPTKVIGIDSSAAMLDKLAAKDCEHAPVLVLGDMIDSLPDGPLGVVFVAFNTFFNLGSEQLQRSCMHAVAQRLGPNGCLVIEALVPDDPPRTGSSVDVKSLTRDRVVLSVARYDGDEQSAEGQFVEFTETGGVRLRPWSIRYTSPSQLDDMAAAAGLSCRHRWQTFAKDPFTPDCTRHVSVYAPL
ncbi:MAG: class I SAM-dependent methyltransferase [Actinomycetota bacterium]